MCSSDLEAATLTIDPGAQKIIMGGTITLTNASQDFIIDYPLLLTADTTFDIAGNIIINDSATKTGSINPDPENNTPLALSLKAGDTKKIQIQNGTSENAGLGTTKPLSTITINSNLELSDDTKFTTSGDDGTIFATNTKELSGSGTLILDGNMKNTGSWTYKTHISVTGNVTDTGTWASDDGKKLIFNGTLT